MSLSRATSRLLRTTFWNSLVAIAVLVGACRSSKGVVAVTPSETIPHSLPAKLVSIDSVPVDSNDQAFKGLSIKSRIIRFYQTRNAQAIWFPGNTKSALADSMVSLIQQSRYSGLLPQDYQLAEIEYLQQAQETHQNLLRTEILLTNAFFEMMEDLRYGRLYSRVDNADDSVYFSAINRVIYESNVRTVLEQEEPVFLGYRELKKAMKYVLDTLPYQIRQTLLWGATADSIHGFREVRAIEINLERWRMETKSFGQRYLFVNIPAYQLYLIAADTLSFQSRIIVGKKDTPTPHLTSLVECFVLFPYWYVPRKIAIEEYLPIIQYSRTFISRNNFDVLNSRGEILNADSIDWNAYNKNYFPVSLRQREGPDNSLGVIKFLFDNPYAVFLHDTNAKKYFRGNMRALSHGCVRVERALDLAHYLITDDLTKQSKTITKYLQQKQRHTVNIPKPIPIYIRYFTCEFRNDQLYYYSDIYEKDTVLIDAFYKKKTGIDF